MRGDPWKINIRNAASKFVITRNSSPDRLEFETKAFRGKKLRWYTRWAQRTGGRWQVIWVVNRPVETIAHQKILDGDQHWMWLFFCHKRPTSLHLQGTCHQNQSSHAHNKVMHISSREGKQQISPYGNSRLLPPTLELHRLELHRSDAQKSYLYQGCRSSIQLPAHMNCFLKKWRMFSSKHQYATIQFLQRLSYIPPPAHPKSKSVKTTMQSKEHSRRFETLANM